MTVGRRLDLAWAELQGRSCLLVQGWTELGLRELGNPDIAELGMRLAVLPSEVVKSGVNLRSLQSIAGHFKVVEDTICFVPKFPFLDGMCYSLVMDLATTGGSVDRIEVGAIQRPTIGDFATTEVVAIYPSGGHLPVNHLRVYIHFSSAMGEGWVTRGVRVHRADTDELLEGVFLSMEPELWDRERRRLTLLLDPGRIKRGLVPNEVDGYPLRESVPIIITINTEFRDATGLPLRSRSEKRYCIGPPLRDRIKPVDWAYHSPMVGSMDPLTVEFDRPLDHALLQHSLWVNDADGLALAGHGYVGSGEGCWRFEPESPWQEGQYQVTVAPRLEDLAGNSLVRVFDRDLTRIEDAPNDAKCFAIDFTCAPAERK